MTITRLCNTRPIEAANPYESIVGDAWNEIAPGVRIALTAPLSASGTLKIQVAHRGVASFLARFILLPPEGAAVSALLEIRQEPSGMRWLRQFDTMKAESLQTFEGSTYIEEAGPFRMAFRTELRGHALAHIQVKTRLFGIRVPRFLGPTVSGLMGEGPDERSWTLVVDIGHCWFGTLCRYEGVMHAQ